MNFKPNWFTYRFLYYIPEVVHRQIFGYARFNLIKYRTQPVFYNTYVLSKFGMYVEEVPKEAFGAQIEFDRHIQRQTDERIV